jgi:putative ABC transport system substrate-binding protein
VRGRQCSHRRGYVTRNTESGTRLRTTDSVLNASTPREIEAAFATLVRDRADALFIMPDAPFISRRIQFATLVARHGIPTVDVEAGGLMSYGTDVLDMYRQVGVYAGQILKGAKPAELPVVQSTKFEFVINAQTARALGLEVPPQLLASADEAIE